LGGAISVGAVLRGTLFSLGLTFVASVCLAVAVAATEWGGELALIPWFSHLSIALGGLLAARASRRSGWLHGALVGGAYFLVAALFFQGGLDVTGVVAAISFPRMLGWVAAGALGGVLGINL